MLPLVTNVLPNTPSALPGNANAGQGASLSTLVDAATAARQQLQVAVAATGAPAAFSPNAQAPKQVQTERRISNITSSQAPVVANEVELPLPPLTGVTLPAAPLPGSFFTSQPLQLGIPLTSQLATQFIAQDAAENMPELAAQTKPTASARNRSGARGGFLLSHDYASELLSVFSPRVMQANMQAEWRTVPVPKKPGITARGAAAYGVAEVRNRSGVSSSTDATL